MRDAWATHPHLEGSVTEKMLEHHDLYRRLGRELVEAAGATPPADDVAERVAYLVKELHLHSAVEDGKIFPIVEGVLGGPLTVSRDEHTALEAATVALEAAVGGDPATLRTEVAHLVEAMEAHLDAEEDAVCPTLLSLTAEETWARFHAGG